MYNGGNCVGSDVATADRLSQLADFECFSESNLPGKPIAAQFEFLLRVVLRRGCATPSPPPRGALSSVNLLANKRDGPLIDRSSIPGLDSSEIGFAGLVSRARAPAVCPEEICRRGQSAGRGI